MMKNGERPGKPWNERKFITSGISIHGKKGGATIVKSIKERTTKVKRGRDVISGGKIHCQAFLRVEWVVGERTKKSLQGAKQGRSNNQNKNKNKNLQLGKNLKKERIERGWKREEFLQK